MSLLPATGPDPVGAAALLGYADPAELARFQALEDAVWGGTSLPPAVVEAVRLRCAQLRGCEFCKAVRVRAAIEDGLSEAHVARLETPDAGAGLGPAQRAALQLVERFLRAPRAPDAAQAAALAAELGSRGVMEVLLACASFATAELRIALGENRPPHGDTVVERARGEVAPRSTRTHWPRLTGPVLDPDSVLPEAAPALTDPVHDLVRALWSGDDLSPGIISACILRSTQLLGVSPADPVYGLLVPPRAASLADGEQVKDWPTWSAERGRDVLTLAEQLWIDPAGVDDTIVAPLAATLGSDGVIRVAWDLIWIGQLHRLALVLHGAREPQQPRQAP